MRCARCAGGMGAKWARREVAPLRGAGESGGCGRRARRIPSLVSRHSSLRPRRPRARRGQEGAGAGAGAGATPTTIPIQHVPGSWAMSSGGRECAGGKPAEGGPRTEARRRKDGARAFWRLQSMAVDGGQHSRPWRSLRLQFSPLFSRAQGARPGGAAFLPRPNGWARLKPHPRNNGLKFGNCRFRVRRAGRRSGGCRRRGRSLRGGIAPGWPTAARRRLCRRR